MTEAVTGPVGAVLRHLQSLAALCRKALSDADFENIRWRLRRGLFADLDRVICRPIDLGDMTPMAWLRVERLQKPVEGTGSPFDDALAAMAMARVPVMVLLTDGGLHLGLRASDSSLGDWVSSVLAPGTLVTPAPEPPMVRTLTDLSNGLVFSMVPSTERKDERAGMPGLARIMLSPPGGWAVVLRLDPVGFDDARSINDELLACAMALARFGTVNDTTSAQQSVTIEHPEAQLLLENVKGMLAHLNAAESAGLWNVSVYVSATSENLLDAVTAATASVLRDEPLAGNRWIAQRCVAQTPGTAGSSALPAPATLMSTYDVAQFLRTGDASLPGVEVAPAPPGGRTVIASTRPVRVGHWSGTDREFAIDLQDLEGHGFITGTTGMGKSTTVQRILLDVWNQHHVRFLIIDPVKADYEELAPSLEGGLTVIDAASLRLNVLQPFPGFSVRTHLELVANAFKGSFAMPTPVPYIVAQLFERLVARAAVDPPPTLHDLRDDLDTFVRSLGYDGEVESNIRASLGLRLALLLAPGKAERMAAPDGTASLRALFEHPAVVQLSTLGDDEERSFLMSVLTLYVAERARVAGRSGGEVRHVTVLEEAHRILPEPQQVSSEEGDPASVSAKLLTQMLAEIRSYGEAVLVIDQSPAAVARDVVRNTNLKLAHRLPDPEDRKVVGGSLGLDEEQQPSLARLRRGEILVTTRRVAEAQTVTVLRPDPAGPVQPQSVRNRVPSEDLRACCEGRSPSIHHAAEARSRGAESAMALALSALVSGAEHWKGVWAATDAALHGLIASDPLLVTDPIDATRCLAWIGLRRGLFRHHAYGQLAADDVQSRHRQAFSLWSQRRIDRRLRLSSGKGPYYGCRWCDAVCRFRHLGEASDDTGAPAVRVSLLPQWSPMAGMETHTRMTYWTAQTTRRLAVALGDDAARSAARCAITQFAAGAQMPLSEQDRLLEPKEST